MIYKEILKQLQTLYPHVETALKNWDGVDWKFMFCVILSAQTTDKQVNKVTGPLFRRFPTLESFVDADISEVTEMIHSIGFFNNKSKFLRDSAKMLLEKYDGNVPMDIDEMQNLPGVGRKTASVVTGVLLDDNFGIAVDTHVSRLSQRLGFTTNTKPEKIEKDLMKLFPDSKIWDDISLMLIEHGRNVCFARNPKCEECKLNKLCPSAFNK